MISRAQKTGDELDDAAIADAVNSYANLIARDWLRREKNAIVPLVLMEVDAVRSKGNSPNVPEIIRMIALDRNLPVPELTGE